MALLSGLSLRALQRVRRSLLRRGNKEQEEARLRGATVMARLRSAIDQKLPVRFLYRPVGEGGRTGIRLVIPYAIYMRNGKRYLNAYTLPSSISATRGLPEWRTFLISRISGVQLPTGSDASLFALGRRRVPGYNPGWYRRVGRPIALRQRI